jgi:hypothetical protein
MGHGLDVAVTRRDEDDAHRAAPREHALDQAASGQRLVIGVRGNDQQALTGPDP